MEWFLLFFRRLKEIFTLFLSSFRYSLQKQYLKSNFFIHCHLQKFHEKQNKLLSNSKSFIGKNISKIKILES